MMKVKVFKMLDGTELLAEEFNPYSEFIEVKNPAAIILQQTQQGVGVALAPFMPYVEGNLKLMRSAIAAEGEPNLQMTNEYSRIFGSGIQIAPAGSI